MCIGRFAVAVCAAVCLQAGTSDAQSRSLTLADILSWDVTCGCCAQAAEPVVLAADELRSTAPVADISPLIPRPAENQPARHPARSQAPPRVVLLRSISFQLGPHTVGQKEFACAWVRTVAVCAVVCLHAGTAAAQSRSLTLAEVLGARARASAADRQRAAGVGGGARAAARRVRSVSGQPGDRRGARQSQRAGHSIHRLRAGPRPELRAGCPPVRSDRRRQRGDRAKLREHRRGHPDGAPLGGLGVLPRGPRE